MLDRGSGSVPLHDLGLSERDCARLKSIADRPHGLFLVSGPTGSGKTTTLYSTLSHVDALTRNVATIEDPIESQMPFVRQSQVDTAIGFGFDRGLRALLRQDPDVILVGEIRDLETAGMAIKASMTGHLVFSTLHTNTAIGAVSRLVDMGVASYLVEDSLIGVLGQRLVRRVCPKCFEWRPPSLAQRPLARARRGAHPRPEGLRALRSHGLFRSHRDRRAVRARQGDRGADPARARAPASSPNAPGATATWTSPTTGAPRSSRA